MTLPGFYFGSLPPGMTRAQAETWAESGPSIDRNLERRKPIAATHFSG